MTWVLGLDGGGSKTALAYTNARAEVVGPFYAPGINPFDQPQWASLLRELLERHPAPGPLLHATLGLPGYGESLEVSAEQDAVCSRLLSCPFSSLNDVEAAFVGAFAGGDGVLLLAGTGSMAWAKSGNRQARVGGWGDAFGDEGSAYWIGRQALSLASQALDGRKPEVECAQFAHALLEPLLGPTGVHQEGLLSWYYTQTHPRSGVAALARTVDALAAQAQGSLGGRVALELLGEAAHHLARHVVAARRSLKAPTLPWSFAGGLLNSVLLRDLLIERLSETPRAPRLPPLGGALFHAARAAGVEVFPAWQDRLAAKLLPGVDANVSSGVSEVLKSLG